MDAHPVRVFKLSPPGKCRGVSCDANGTSIAGVPLLKRTIVSGKEKWMPRDGDDISADLSKRFGLPIDFSSKTSGVAAIAKALNEGSVARAQLAALFLRFPDPLSLEKSAASRSGLIKFVQELHTSDLLKATWEPAEHPRWPGGSDDHQGGRFAPKSEQLESTLADEVAQLPKTAPAVRSKPRLRAWAEVAPKLDPNYQGIPFWMIPIFGEASAGEEIAAEAKGAVEELISRDIKAAARSKIDRYAFKQEREAYWKDEAQRDPSLRRLPPDTYTDENLARMRDGKPPFGEDGHPIELHHPSGSPSEPPLPMTRTDHRLGPNYRLNHPWLRNDPHD